jgi:hypothetical protein
MSRFYLMSVAISEHDPAKVKAIQAAAEAEWSFDDWGSGADAPGGTLYASAEGYLAGGETEEEFTERLSLAVWRANGGYCRVSVDATYMENLPYETHTLDEEDYARLVKERNTK